MDYINSIQKSLDFIEENLEEKLTLEKIANEIFISPYHFSRIFKAILKVNLSEYIKMRRLAKASELLVNTNIKILEIAIISGFESQESFSAAFKIFSSYTPYTFRKKKPKIIKYPRKELYLANLKIKNLKGSVYMKYEIVERKEIKLVGIKERVFFSKENTIPKIWGKFFLEIDKIQNKVGKNCYGVAFNMEIKSEVSNEITTKSIEEFDEMVCVEVSSFDNVPEGMITKTISPQKYLVFTYKGNPSAEDFPRKIAKTYDYLYGTLLPATEFQVDKEFNFELYNDNFKMNDDNSKFDIYIPIK